VAVRRRERDERRSFWLLVANGALMMSAMTFVSSDLVLPAFVQTLSTSSVMVGLAGALMRIGWAWPQVFISRVVEPMPRKMPVFILAGTVRTLMWVAVGLLTMWMGAEQPTTLLIVFMVMYGLATSCMGITNVPWMDIIGKSVQPSDRARMFAVRRLAGGATAMVSGALISWMLSDRSGLTFPDNYAMLFILSGVGTGLSIAAFARIREPVQQKRGRTLPLKDYIQVGLGLLRDDVNYRRLCILQFLWAFSMMATPFFVPFALTDLNMDVSVVGLFVAVMQFSSIFSNVIWAWVGQKKGNQALLSIGTYFLAFSILIPLTVQWIPQIEVSAFAWAGSEGAFDLRVGYYALTFVFTGFAMSGMFTGRMTYVLDIAPEDRRPTYTSFMNAAMLPQGVLPVLGGWLVALISYQNMFCVSLAFVPVAVWMARKLKAVKA
jgi:MFS family permease